jgi:TRAP-type C4-dicarboxylate transport system substrate-binding protein
VKVNVVKECSMRKLLIAAAAAALPLSAQAAEPIQLKFGSAIPAIAWPNTMAVVPWSNQVEKDSGGTVKFTLFAGRTVVSSQNGLDRMQNGVVDALYGTASDTPGQFPRTDVSSMPFEVNKSVDASTALWRLYEKHYIDMEYTKFHPLAIFVFNASRIHANRPIQSADDLKGLKVAVFSRMLADIVNDIGGTPVTVATTELYETMQRNLAQVEIMGWTGTQTFKVTEVTKYHLDVPLGSSPGYLLMNKQSYEKLPAVAKAAIDKNSGLPATLLMARSSDTVEAQVRERTKGLQGHTVAELPPAELARWKKMVAPLVDEWVKETPDGAKVLAAYRKELADLHAANN